MNILIVALHVVASIALIAIVLLQTGKGAEMGAAFGGASQTLFGGTGGTSFLSKLTTGAAVVFMITCLLLSYRPSTYTGRSVMEDVPAQQQQQEAVPAPVLPEARPVQPDTPAPAPQAAPAPEPSAQQPAAQEAPKQQESQKAKEPVDAKPVSAKPQQQKKDKAPDKR